MKNGYSELTTDAMREEREFSIDLLVRDKSFGNSDRYAWRIETKTAKNLPVSGTSLPVRIYKVFATVAGNARSIMHSRPERNRRRAGRHQHMGQVVGMDIASLTQFLFG